MEANFPEFDVLSNQYQVLTYSMFIALFQQSVSSLLYQINEVLERKLLKTLNRFFLIYTKRNSNTRIRSPIRIRLELLLTHF